MKQTLFLLLVPIFFLSNCKKDDESLFQLAYAEEFVIPAGINPFETHYFVLDIPIGTYFTANDVEPQDLNAINPRSSRMATIFSGISDYDFISDISVRMYTVDPDDYLEIFYRDPVPLNAGEDLDLVPTLVDARSLMTETHFKLLVRLELRAAPTETIETRFTFSLDAK